MYKLNESTIDVIEKSSKNRISVCKHVMDEYGGGAREEALDCAKSLIQNEFFFHSFPSFVRSFVLWLSDFCFVFFHGFRIVCSVFGLTQIFLDFEGEKNRIEKSRRIEILSAAFWHRAHSSAFQIVRAKGISFGEKTQPYRIIS